MKNPKKLRAKEEPDYKRFGLFCRMLRDSRTMSLRDVVEYSGIPKSTIQDMEHGRTKDPKFYTIIKLSEVYREPMGNFIAILMKSKPPPKIHHRMNVWYKNQGRIQ